MDLTQLVVASCAGAVANQAAEKVLHDPGAEMAPYLAMQAAVEGAVRRLLAEVQTPCIKGEAVLMWDVPAAANGLSEYAVDCRRYNALHVHVIVTGTTPSATISVEGSPGEGGNYVALADPNASRVAVSTETAFDVMIGAAWARIRIAAISGTYGLGLGYTIRCTPYVAAGQPRAGTYPTATHTTATVTTATGVALAASGARRYALFINDSDTTVYLMIAASAVANQGIRLNPNGGSYEMSGELGNLNAAAVNAIHAGTGNKTLLGLQGT